MNESPTQLTAALALGLAYIITEVALNVADLAGVGRSVMNYYRPGFLTLGTTDMRGRKILQCVGLPCALWDVWQHPWPLH